MEKLIFKNLYLNIIFGGLLILLSLLGYFLNWFQDYLPLFTAIILILLSTKRFWYSFKKIISKYATLILIIEFILDVALAALLIYLEDYVGVFIGLIIYIRGVSYLLINYLATRKIRLFQYILNIGYVTIGSFLMFSSFAKGNILVIFITVLILLTGIIYLQAGLSRLAKKKENNIEKEQTTKQEIKEAKKETKEHPKKNENLQQDEPKATGSIPTMNQLTAMTVAELKTLAKNRNLEGYSQLNKKSLIEKVKSSYKN